MATGTYRLEAATKVVAADLGINLADVLRRASLPADLLARDPVRLPESDYFAFWNALDEEAGDPHLPVRIAEVLTGEIFDVALFAALVSPDLDTAARRVADHKRLLCPIHLDVANDGQHLTIEYRWPSDVSPPAVLVLTELLFWVSLARLGTRHRIEPRRLTAPEAPAGDEPYQQYLGDTIIETGPTRSIEFSAWDARRPFLTTNDALWSTFEPELRRRLAELDAEADTSERVRAALLELLPAGQPTMAAVARQLALSTRTLHRRLQNENTNFQTILSSTREALARHYLADRDVSVGEISFLLGYEEPSSFYRAFHHWTGQTPERIRSSTA